MNLTVIDIVALVFVLIFIISGFKRGFMQELIKLITWIFSLVGSKLLAPLTSEWLYTKLEIDNKLTVKLTEIVSNLDFSSVESVRSSIESGISGIPFIGGLLSGITDGNWGITEAFQSARATIQEEIVGILKELISPIAMNVLETVSFIVLFFVLLLVIGFILNSVRSLFHKIKLLGFVDNLLGALVGLIKGAIFFIIIYSLVFVILSLTGSEYLAVLQNSWIFDILGLGKF